MGWLILTFPAGRELGAVFGLDGDRAGRGADRAGQPSTPVLTIPFPLW